ncbi:MAG: S41 family peptidase [Desulfovibrionaceae bacterium]|nr:S41 family peptidase [Desulfovibrionaceae bacterium]MDD4952618.1 S41 family peptidase [Desulfovibrionaceae bacterium]
MRVFLWLATVLLLFTLMVSPGPGLAEKDSHFEALRRFSQVLDMVETHYVKDISRQELIEDSIKGMLEQLDPHSSYLSADDFKEIQLSTKGEFSGIGIEISLDNGRLVVVSPIEDTPAYKAGIEAGDIIFEIDGTSTQDITLMDAVKKIRGPNGTPVVLSILHKDSQKPEEVTVVRGTIPIVSVKSRELEDGYLYLRLTRFNDNTTPNMRKAIDDYAKDKKLKGIVLDLRNNPGGLLEQAVSVSDVFLPGGLVVYIQGKHKEQRKDFPAHKNTDDVTAPIVTLINSGSASASEIVAGALQDHKRSLLLGEKTFGKGSVQTVIPLSDGAGIKLTTALYYTPNGRSIQAEGIVPDLAIPYMPPPSKEDAEFLDLKKRYTYREKDLTRHLHNNVKGGKGKREIDEKTKDMLEKDNQLRLALELVKQLPNIKKIQ